MSDRWLEKLVWKQKSTFTKTLGTWHTIWGRFYNVAVIEWVTKMCARKIGVWSYLEKLRLFSQRIQNFLSHKCHVTNRSGNTWHRDNTDLMLLKNCFIIYFFFIKFSKQQLAKLKIPFWAWMENNGTLLLWLMKCVLKQDIAVNLVFKLFHLLL